MTNMKSLAIIALILLFGCLGQNPSSQNTQTSTQEPATISLPRGTADYTYYSSPLYLLYYPRGWYLAEPQNGVVIIDSPADGPDNFSQQFVVEIWAGNQSTAEEFESYERSLLTPQDKIISKNQTTFHNTAAFVIEYQSPLSSPPLQYKTIFFRNGKWVYRLSYAVEQSRLDKFRPTMESILEKFQIGNG
ncbi:hypothetical protein HY988_06475 [Candidatus Micrarchaeota archaeon]|nr:hypothetical protein [Candidatus Micrarchaeota archaeon]